MKRGGFEKRWFRLYSSAMSTYVFVKLMCVRNNMYVSSCYMCLLYYYVSSYYYMCPHTAMCVSAYYCVRILLHVSACRGLHDQTLRDMK
jgi:hypothetical protein